MKDDGQEYNNTYKDGYGISNIVFLLFMLYVAAMAITGQVDESGKRQLLKVKEVKVERSRQG
jgi:hypothetical protein